MPDDKFVVGAKWNALNVEGYVPLQNSGKFVKAIVYFLKTGRKISCKITDRANAVNKVYREERRMPLSSDLIIIIIITQARS